MERHTFEEHAGVHLGGVELVRLGAGVALLPHEHVLLDVSLPDVGHRVNDVGQLQLPQRRNLVIREQSVLLVLKPEPVIIIIIIIITIITSSSPVRISEPLELLLDDLGKERPGTTIALQHPAHVQVDVHHVA